MNDLSQTIAAKSDQLNTDDLIGGPRTIKVTRVVINKGAEQPAWVYFEGDDNKPYKPGLSMRRMLVHVWGNDTAQYAGRRMTLYRDDNVRFGSLEVGGIRISHMSNISAPVTRALTEKKGSKKAFTVKPLPAERSAEAGASQQPSARDRLYAAARAEAAKGSEALRAFRNSLEERADRALDAIGVELDDLAAQADDAPADDGDSFPGDDALDALRQAEHA